MANIKSQYFLNYTKYSININENIEKNTLRLYKMNI